ncbi:MAG: N-6 DNA methylase [Chloroherpetonaceae bacterium]|nr:N-6 DNA methylase [Chloroherpetonaceae bacterium]
MSASFQDAFEQVRQLVQVFKANEDAYLDPAYSEAQARQDFIDAFFIALGWDVRHERQKNPYEQEVKIENRVATQGAQRRADYAFFIAPNFRDEDVKFFVEAKKPSLALSAADHYYQTMRYGWNRKTPLAALTNFREFHIIDCRYKPNIAYALDGGIKVFSCDDYLDEEKFAELYYLFSREAVANGALEKFAESLPKPKGKAAQKGLFKGGLKKVDDAFLESLDGYRETLAENFKAKNPHLDGETLTEAVQRTLDRLVFIRFLEDKQIEEPLVKRFGDKGDSWKAFRSYCRSLEPKYNGLVFNPHTVIDSDDFNPPDEAVFGKICRELSDDHSPYDFGQIPIAILGSIYERFLGKVVSVTDSRAKVIEKPQVRKAGGIYYTPEYIVRYIVAETVGKLIEGKTPDEISKMAFADIACGSGSFLIEVYATLLDYHERYYAANPDKARQGDLEWRDGVPALSLKKRREILARNIFGCDIDYQAVEVTQLSLYLKLLENATTGEAHQFSLLKEAILPNLSRNIVCGNSLIETDILESALFEPDEERKLNPMNFEDAFPDIMKRGGFDAIVGNPPWVDIKGMPRVQAQYFFKRYETTENRMNIYATFIERAFQLLKKGSKDAPSYLGYITPNSYLTQSSYRKLRKLILENYKIVKLVRLPDDIFKGVKAETLISIFNTYQRTTDGSVDILIFDRSAKIAEIDKSKGVFKRENQKVWRQGEDYLINIFSSDRERKLLSRVETGATPLESLCDFSLGITPYDKHKGHTQKQIKARVFHATYKKTSSHKPLLSGENIIRYRIDPNVKEWIAYGEWLGAPREKRFFTEERILVRQIVSGKPPRIYAAYTDAELYNTQIAFNLLRKPDCKLSLKYILAILNSKLMTFYHRKKYLDQSKEVFQKILIQDCKRFPIRLLDLSKPAEKAIHDRIVKLVEQMMATMEKLSRAQTEKEKLRLNRMAEGLDRQIDAAVYELYGLTEAEIELVEG